MINLEVFGQSTAMAAVAQSLEAAEGVSRVGLVDATRAEHSIVLAAARPRAVDRRSSFNAPLRRRALARREGTPVLRRGRGMR